MARLARSYLARAPAVKGGVETTVVSPAVKKLLTDWGIPFATEVTFELLDSNGQPVLEGRFDIVFRRPDTKELMLPELKGDKLDALTKGQKTYVPLFESPGGAAARITRTGGGNLLLPPGHVEHIHGQQFWRVGSANLPEFAKFVEFFATGRRPANVVYDRGRLLAFHSQAEFDAFLVNEKGMVVQKLPPKPNIANTPNPAKPPGPSEKPARNPLYDPPSPERRSSRADPEAGPPENPARKGPNPKPRPYEPDRPAKAGTASAKPKPPPTSEAAKQAPAGVRTREHLGEAPTPIEVPEPAVQQQSKQSAIQGAAIALVAAQIGSLRSAEMQKAVKRLEQLSGEIETERKMGHGVTVTLEVEVPDQVDIAAIWAGIGDAGQIVYFSDMRISAVTTRSQSQDTSHAQMRSAGQTDYSRGPWYAKKPARKGWHYAQRDLQLPPIDPLSTGNEMEGVWSTAGVLSSKYGSANDISLNALHRTVVLGDDAPKMFDDDAPTKPWNVTPTFSGGPLRFERTVQPKVTITSEFRLTTVQLKGVPMKVLVETAEGKGNVYGRWTHWKAEIIWNRER